MNDDRWVVLGLAHPRAGWFSEMARWATSAALPIEFVKCVSADEVRARLGAGRAYSALLVGSGVRSLDRDLVDSVRSSGAAVIVVGADDRRWSRLPVSARLPEVFDRTDLLAALQECAPPIARVEPTLDEAPTELDAGWRGRLVAVTGSGGTGASVVAMAIAQGLAADASNRGLVLLADLCLRADQAMLHDARDVVPGIQELVEAHRGDRLPLDEVRTMTFDAVDHGYHLLLGLRQHQDWTAIRPRALAAALDGLLRSYRLVVADVDADIEGEPETGSLDVEDRNILARTAIRGADVVIVVGTTGLKGLHSLVNTVQSLVRGGVVPHRVVPVINRCPRRPRHRSELTGAFAKLLRESREPLAIDNPVLVPHRRDVEDALRDGVRLPTSVGRAVIAEVRRRFVGLEPGPERVEATPIRPGSIGVWSTEEAG